MHSAIIRQRFLEGSDLKLTSVYDKAPSLHDGQRNAGAYALNASFPPVAITRPDGKEYPAGSRRCFHCGDGPHDRQHCPANGCSCSNCGKTGNFSRVCKAARRIKTAALRDNEGLALVTQKEKRKDSQVYAYVRLNGASGTALLDTAATPSH